jgi:RIO-like serine/threonine protein kinase
MMGMDCGEQSMEAALMQLIETGVMHADLHAGNILLSPDSTLQFIDFFPCLPHGEKAPRSNAGFDSSFGEWRVA